MTAPTATDQVDSADTPVVEVRDGALRSFTVDAAEVGLATAQPDELNGGDPVFNAEIARCVLAGERGAPRDVAVLNAGAGVYAGGHAETLEAGVRAAEAAIDSGAAATVLEHYITFTQEAAREASSA